MSGPFDLTGKVVLVTGASRGLGRSMADGLAAAGATVVLAARDAAALETARAELVAGGGKAAVVTVDLTSRASVDAMVARVKEEHGRIDVLVNNAGVIQIKPFSEVTEEDIARIIETNLLGVLRCAQAVGRVMIAQGGGKIINIGSSAGLRGRSLEVPYAASKGGVNALTLSLAVEWARYNINVNAVCPAYFLTPMNEEALSEPALRAKIESRIPLRRIGRPEELAPTIVYLASAAADYVTGQIIAVDGGTTAK